METRITTQVLKVLMVFMENPLDGASGADITRRTKLLSGTLYPILMRLEAAGWLESNWEDVDPSKVGRPRRRFYKITAAGQNAANKAMAELGVVKGVPSWA